MRVDPWFSVFKTLCVGVLPSLVGSTPMRPRHETPRNGAEIRQPVAHPWPALDLALRIDSKTDSKTSCPTGEDGRYRGCDIIVHYQRPALGAPLHLRRWGGRTATPLIRYRP